VALRVRSLSFTLTPTLRRAHHKHTIPTHARTNAHICTHTPTYTHSHTLTRYLRACALLLYSHVGTSTHSYKHTVSLSLSLSLSLYISRSFFNSLSLTHALTHACTHTHAQTCTHAHSNTTMAPFFQHSKSGHARLGRTFLICMYVFVVFDV